LRYPNLKSGWSILKGLPIESRLGMNGCSNNRLDNRAQVTNAY
jgi:hypothetical protein